MGIVLYFIKISNEVKLCYFVCGGFSNSDKIAKLNNNRYACVHVATKLQKVNKSGRKRMQKSALKFLSNFSKFFLQLVSWVGIYTKTIRLKHNFVVYESIINLGFTLVVYLFINNSDLLSNH